MLEMEEFIESLRETFFALRGASTRMLEDLGCSPAERGVLAELGKHGPRPVPPMARLRGVSRQAMQKVVDSMIEHGWVRTEPNPEHARSQLISLTAAGEKLLATIRRRETSLMLGTGIPVSPGELARSTAVLVKLKPFFEAVS